MKRICCLLAFYFCALPALALAEVECVPQIKPQMKVTALDFSPDGRLLAEGGSEGWSQVEGEVNVFDAASGELLRALPPQRGFVTLVRFAADGTTLVTGTSEDYQSSADGIVRFWDLKTGRLLRSLPAPHRVAAVAVSRNGQWVARFEKRPFQMNAEVPQAAHVSLASFEPREAQWNKPELHITLENVATNSKRILTTSPLWKMDFSSDSRFLWGIDDKGFIVWDVTSGQASRPAKPDLAGIKTQAPRAPSYVGPLAYSSDMKLWAGWCADHVGVWESATGHRRAWLALPSQPAGSNGMRAGVAAIFPNDNQVAVCSTPPVPARGDLPPHGQLLLCSLSGNAAAPQVIPLKFSLNPETFAVAPKGDTLAVGFSPTFIERQVPRTFRYGVRLISLDSGQSRELVGGYLNRPWRLTFSSDGTTILSLWQDDRLRVWSARTGQLQRAQAIRVAPFAPPSISPSGQLIAENTEADESAAGLKIIKSSDGASFIFPGARSETAAFSSDDKFVAIPAKQSVEVYELATRKLAHKIAFRGDRLKLFAFSPDGKLLIGGDAQRAVYLWTLADGELWGRLTEANLWADAAFFSPDGKLIATVEPDRVMLWDVASQRPVQICAADSSITAIAFAPDGGSLVISSLISLRIYALKNLPDAKTALRDGPRKGGEPTRTITSPGGAVIAVAFSPDGATIAAACGDGALYLVNAATGETRAQLRVLPPPRDGEISQEWVALTPDSFFTGSPNAASFLRWRDGDKWVADGARFQDAAKVQQALAP